MNRAFVFLACSISFACAGEIVQLDGIVIPESVSSLEERKDDSIAKRIISGAELSQYGDLNALEILKRTPGVTIPEGKTKKGAPGKGYTVILIDGEEASTGSKRRPSPLEQISPDMIERIEVMTNSSAEYTAEAMGGIVNIVLKKPKSQGKTTAKLTLGAYGDQPMATLYAQREGKTGNLSYLVNTTLSDNQKSDKESINTLLPTSSQEERDDKVRDRMFNMTTKLIYTPSSKEKYMFDGTVAFSDNKTNTLDQNVSTNLLRQESESAKSVMLWSKISGEYHLSGTELIEWKVKFHQNDEDAQIISEEITPTPSNQTQKETTLFRVFGANTDYSVAKGDHFIKSGAEVKHLYQDNTVNHSDGSREDLTLSENRGAIYLQDEISIGETLIVTPGMRYENVSRDVSQNSHIGFLAPSLHLLYKLTPNDNLRGSLAKTVKLPQLNDLSSTLVSSLKQNDINHPDHVGNPNLTEESALSYELRGEHYFEDKGIVSLGGFYRDINDKIEKMITWDGSRYTERPQNAGNGKLWGIELELKKSLDAYIEGAGVFANMTFQNSILSVGSVKRPIKQTPDYLYNVGADHTLKAYALTYGAAYRYVGGYDDPIDENGFAETQKGYGVLDLYLSKRLDSTFKLGLNLKNITSNTITTTSMRYASGILNEVQIDHEGSKPQILLSLEGRW